MVPFRIRVEVGIVGPNVGQTRQDYRSLGMTIKETAGEKTHINNGKSDYLRLLQGDILRFESRWEETLYPRGFLLP